MWSGSHVLSSQSLNLLLYSAFQIKVDFMSFTVSMYSSGVSELAILLMEPSAISLLVRIPFAAAESHLSQACSLWKSHRSTTQPKTKVKQKFKGHTNSCHFVGYTKWKCLVENLLFANYRKIPPKFTICKERSPRVHWVRMSFPFR